MRRSRFEYMTEALLHHIPREETLRPLLPNNASQDIGWQQAALQFIAGPTLEECIEVAHRIEAQGFAVMIEWIGESARDKPAASQASEEFLKLIRTIEERKLSASVSLDLKEIGLLISDSLVFENAVTIAQAADNAGLELMINMEGTEHVDKILEMHCHLCYHFNNVGITLQACLTRTPTDLALAAERPGRIRLVRGECEASDGTAHSPTDAVDSFRSLAADLIWRNHYSSLVIDDASFFQDLQTFIETRHLKTNDVEFEVRYGPAAEHAQEMRDLGFHTHEFPSLTDQSGIRISADGLQSLLIFINCATGSQY